MGLFYIRYLDDILVLAPTRWKLRRAVQVLNQTLQSLKLEKAPDKTFIGRIERGFDFLGYHLHQGRLSLAEKTVEKFAERARRLYERERGKQHCFSPLGKYVRRWVAWAYAGIGGAELDLTHFRGGTLDCVLKIVGVWQSYPKTRPTRPIA